MFVLDGAKARLVVFAMAAATAIPLFPTARAAEAPRPKAVAQTVEVKAPKKTKKKKSPAPHHTKPVTKLHTKPISTWRRPMGPVAAMSKKVDKLKIVLAVARQQLGKPYHYGSTGPSSFDCSGFTQFVWKHAGVMLPHNSSAQRAATKHVSLKDARPGDLVFSPGHVGLYIGDGKMIHAPQTGQSVEISPIHGSTYGAGRPAA